jgi:hypothetical protein
LIRPGSSIGYWLLVGWANVASPYFSISEFAEQARRTWRSIPKSLVNRHRRRALSNQARQPSGQTKPARIVYHEVAYSYLLPPLRAANVNSPMSMCDTAGKGGLLGLRYGPTQSNGSTPPGTRSYTRTRTPRWVPNVLDQQQLSAPFKIVSSGARRIRRPDTPPASASARRVSYPQ